MEGHLARLKATFPNLSATTAYGVLQLHYQYETHLLGRVLREFSVEEFPKLWENTSPAKGVETPIEYKLAAFLANPKSAVAVELEAQIRGILDETMIVDELEEVRRLYLQNIFADGELGLLDVRAHLLRDQRWLWTLNPSWETAYGTEDKAEFLKLKYEFFQSMGWLNDATRQNHVLHFQLSYLEQPKMSLLELLLLDMDILQGSEIFLRLKHVNPFLISYFYSCYKQGRADLLSEFKLRNA